MHWCISHRADATTRQLADRHYNRQSVGATGFVPPGRCLVLLSQDAKAFWITSWPFAEFTKHAWAGAWVCSAFRNEGAGLSSELIREAVSVTRWYREREPSWESDPLPALGMITFVDTTKVRHKRDPGRCYRRAGFRLAGSTKGGLVALRLAPEDMPDATAPVNAEAWQPKREALGATTMDLLATKDAA